MTNMHQPDCIRVPLFLVLSIFLANTLFGQSLRSDLKERLLTMYRENAEKVEIGGVEYQGRKTGSTKFTKCDGVVIDIGNKQTKKAGPCPEDGSPKNIRGIPGFLGDVDVSSSMLEIIDDAGKSYKFFLPKTARGIFDGEIGEPGKLSFDEIKRGKRVVVFSVLEGRIEAIALR